MQSIVVELDELTTFEQDPKADIHRHLRSSVSQVFAFKEAIAAVRLLKKPIGNLMIKHHRRVLLHCSPSLIPSTNL